MSKTLADKILEVQEINQIDIPWEISRHLKIVMWGDRFHFDGSDGDFMDLEEFQKVAKWMYKQSRPSKKGK